MTKFTSESWPIFLCFRRSVTFSAPFPAFLTKKVFAQVHSPFLSLVWSVLPVQIHYRQIRVPGNPHGDTLVTCSWQREYEVLLHVSALWKQLLWCSFMFAFCSQFIGPNPRLQHILNALLSYSNTETGIFKEGPISRGKIPQHTHFSCYIARLI